MCCTNDFLDGRPLPPRRCDFTSTTFLCIQLRFCNVLLASSTSTTPSPAPRWPAASSCCDFSLPLTTLLCYLLQNLDFSFFLRAVFTVGQSRLTSAFFSCRDEPPFSLPHRTKPLLRSSLIYLFDSSFYLYLKRRFSNAIKRRAFSSQGSISSAAFDLGVSGITQPCVAARCPTLPPMLRPCIA